MIIREDAPFMPAHRSRGQNQRLLAEFRTLQTSFEKKGYFKTSVQRLSFEITLMIALFGASYVLWYRDFAAVAWLIAIATSIHLTWWIHDCGHDAFFRDRRWARWSTELLGVTFLGMPQIGFNFDVHRRHHGATNVLGKDSALETGPIVWCPEMISDREKAPIKHQALVWLLVIVPLTFPFLTFEGLRASWQKKRLHEVAFWIARWAVWLGVLKFSFAFLFFPPLIAGALLGLVGSFNHFAMPMSRHAPAPFPAHIFMVTQNLRDRRGWITWLFGGLNFHIEHHLFPRMPSRNYPLIASDVEAFARRNGLPYPAVGTAEAMKNLIQTLNDPGRNRPGESANA